jgi:type IV secretory pathway TrbD component
MNVDCGSPLRIMHLQHGRRTLGQKGNIVEVVSSSGTWTRMEFMHVQRREYLVLVVSLLLYGVIFGNLLWCLAFGLLVYAVAVMGVLPFALWKKTPSLREPRTLTVDDNGITIVAASFSRVDEWTAISGSKERSEYFVLRKKNGGRSIIILKRFFNGPNDDDLLRTLLKANAKLSTSQ